MTKCTFSLNNTLCCSFLCSLVARLQSRRTLADLAAEGAVEFRPVAEGSPVAGRSGAPEGSSVAGSSGAVEGSPVAGSSGASEGSSVAGSSGASEGSSVAGNSRGTDCR